VPILVVAALFLVSACKPAADLSSVADDVERQEAGKSGTTTVPAGTGTKMHQGDGVTVYSSGYAKLDMGCCVLDIYINTNLRADEIPTKSVPACTTDLSHGTVYAHCDSKITINAGWVTITNLGSDFWVYLDDVRRIVWIIVDTGAVDVQATGLTVRVNEGWQTWVPEGSAPIQPRPATRQEVGDLFPPIEDLTNNRLQDPSLLGTVEVPPVAGVPPVVDDLRGTVTLWHSLSGSQVRAMEEAISAFQAQHPNVKFAIVPQPADQMRQSFSVSLSAGAGPSLLIAPPDWGPAWLDAGVVADMSTMVPPDLLHSISPAALDSVRYRDALVGLPYTLKGVVMYRNRSIIPQAPRTFDELLEMAKAATRGDMVGADLERGFFYSGAHLNGIGGQLMDGNGYPTFYSEKGMEWVNLLRAFSATGPAEYYSDDDLKRFQAGLAGIIIDGTWSLETLRNSIGPENLSIDPWPAYGEGHLSGYVQPDVIYLNAATSGDDQHAALRFVEYLLSPENQHRLTLFAQIPVVEGVPVDDPLLRQAMEAFQGGTLFTALPEWDLYWGPMDKALTAAFEQAGDPSGFLEAAYGQISQAVNAMHSGQ